MKTCNKCGQTKEFSEFYKDKGKSDGYRTYCKQCHINADKERKNNVLKQLEAEVRKSIISENKFLLLENKRLCSWCKTPMLITPYNSYTCNKCKRILNAKTKEIKSEYYKKWCETNKEKQKEYKRIYAQKLRLKKKLEKENICNESK